MKYWIIISKSPLESFFQAGEFILYAFRRFNGFAYDGVRVRGIDGAFATHLTYNNALNTTYIINERITEKSRL